MDTNDLRTVFYLDQITAAVDEDNPDNLRELVADLFGVPSGQEPTSDMWNAVLEATTGDV